MRFPISFRAALVLLAGATGLVHAQQTPPFPFQLIATTPTQSQSVANGGTITFLSEVGKTQTVHVVAKYTGNGQVVISQLTQVFGSTAFTVTLSGPQPLQKLPYTLNPGDSIALDIVFAPSSALQVSAQIIQPFSETAASSTGTLQTTQNSINLNVVGTAPTFAFSYTLQSTQNVTPVQPGGTITFPPTLINTSAQASFNITNIGSGAGQISNITLTAGSAFKLQAIPLFPFLLPAGQAAASTLQVLIVYTPSSVTATDTGQIQVTYGSGTTVTFNLQGSGSSSTFTYTVIQSGSSTTVLPNGTITLPDTNIGSTSSVIIQVQNTGNAVGTVNSVNLTGQGYQLVGVPLTPPTLKPNDSFTFSINFTPTQPGPFKGELAIGADLFNLTGQGLGPQLGFSYMSAAGTITLDPNKPSVVFSPLQVSQSQQLPFVVTNTGTLPATVSNLSIGESKSPFSLSGQPPLPITIAPGKSFQFNIVYAPATVGLNQGTLLVDTTVIALSGSGTPPPALPAYTFQGASGNVSPQSQPGIGLQLSSSYPVTLAGTLTMTTSGNLPSDTAAQFATGGRTVPFVIPANTTSAIFAGEGTQVFLQTGTVAESITLTPDFITQAGGVDVTPAAPPAVELTIAPSAPTLLSLQVAGATSNSFTLTATGYSTTRTLTALNVTFTPSAGFNVPAVQFSMDLHQISTQWFQSTAAQSFGGQFSISIPFTLHGTVGTGQTLLQTLASAALTVSNEVGTSNSLQAPLQ